MRRTWVLGWAVLGGWLGGVVGVGAAAESSADQVLVSVNGDMITAADLDGMIMNSHRTRDMNRTSADDLRRLLEKAIHDRLIVLEARAMGFHEDRAVVEPVQESRVKRAIQAYVDANFSPPTEADPARVRSYFETYYWKILLRQLSVRTLEEAQSVREQIQSGASMEELARSISLDTHRSRGGLHNLKYWADVEIPLREASQTLAVGELSPPFPYREAFSMVRVEQRTPVDEEAFPARKEGIRGHLLEQDRRAAWDGFVQDLLQRTPVTPMPAALERIRADSDLVFRGEFMKPHQEPALVLDAWTMVTEAELRREASHAAMRDGTASFETILERAIEAKEQHLVLRHAAERAGLLADPEIEAAYQEDLEAALIEAYLAETVVSRIRFNHEEFRDYYEQNQDDFRGPPEVRLAMLVLPDSATAKEAEQRLREGADFRYLKRHYEKLSSLPESSSRWASESVFSEEIRQQLRGMEVGGTSRAVEIPTGWLVFKLENRRPGKIATLEEADLQLREVMFQRKFNELLDEHLALLKERSDIVRHPERIEAYFGAPTSPEPGER